VNRGLIGDMCKNRAKKKRIQGYLQMCNLNYFKKKRKLLDAQQLAVRRIYN